MGRVRRGKRAKCHRLSKGLEIHDLGSSLGEKALAWAERAGFYERLKESNLCWCSPLQSARLAQIQKCHHLAVRQGFLFQ
jgi:hypothetical protein